MDEKKGKLIEKYRRLYQNVTDEGFADAGGIFTRNKRNQLLDMKGKRRTRRRYDFWYDVRTYVRSALIDLQLFMDTAEAKDVYDALNAATLNPVVSALLEQGEKTIARSEKAKIAQRFIEAGFAFLQWEGRDVLTPTLNNQITEAIDTGRLIANYLVPEDERI